MSRKSPLDVLSEIEEKTGLSGLDTIERNEVALIVMNEILDRIVELERKYVKGK